MSTTPRGDYDPATHTPLTFHDATARFSDGADTPVDYLERCLSAIDAREPTVQAFVTLNRDSAREAAAASAERWARATSTAGSTAPPNGSESSPAASS